MSEYLLLFDSKVVQISIASLYTEFIMRFYLIQNEWTYLTTKPHLYFFVSSQKR